VADAALLLDGLDAAPAAIAAHVELSLERGALADAQAVLDRRPKADEDRLLVLRGALVLAAGDLDQARATAKALHDVAATTGRADLAAEAALLDGRAAAVDGDVVAATEALDDAVARFSALRFPLEAGRARLALARVQATGGSPLALSTARIARDGFRGARCACLRGPRCLPAPGARRLGALGDPR
jgi:hypothetical protein